MLRVSEQDGHRRRDGFVSSYRQLGASLLDLQEAADRVFDTISQGIAEERDKLAEISEGIQKAKAGIDSISSSKGSLIIRSPSKYPSASVSERDVHPLFGSKDGSTNPCLPAANILVDAGLNREFGIFGLDGMLGLFQFFTEANISDFQKVGQPKMIVEQSSAALFQQLWYQSQVGSKLGERIGFRSRLLSQGLQIELKENKKRDAKALFFIQQAVHESIFARIATAATSKEAWKILKNEFQGSTKVRLGDDNHVNVEGKGTIAVKTNSGEALDPETEEFARSDSDQEI